MAPLYGTTPWQAILYSHDNFSKLLSFSADSSLATYHSLFAVTWYFTGKPLSFNAAVYIACSHSPHNVLHSPSYYWKERCL